MHYVILFFRKPLDPMKPGHEGCETTEFKSFLKKHFHAIAWHFLTKFISLLWYNSAKNIEMSHKYATSRINSPCCGVVYKNQQALTRLSDIFFWIIIFLAWEPWLLDMFKITWAHVGTSSLIVWYSSNTTWDLIYGPFMITLVRIISLDLS